MLVCEYANAHAHTPKHIHTKMLMSARTMGHLAWHGQIFLFLSCCQPHNVDSIIDAITLGPLPRWPLALGHYEVQVVCLLFNCVWQFLIRAKFLIVAYHGQDAQHIHVEVGLLSDLACF